MPTNGRASKIKGWRHEKDVAVYLSEQLGLTVERNGANYGKADRGDLRGVPGWALECKSEQRIDLPGYMREGEAESVNAGTDWFAAVVKARGKSVDQSFVVIPLWLFARLLRRFFLGG